MLLLFYQDQVHCTSANKTVKHGRLLIFYSSSHLRGMVSMLPLKGHNSLRFIIYCHSRLCVRHHATIIIFLHDAIIIKIATGFIGVYNYVQVFYLLVHDYL